MTLIKNMFHRFTLAPMLLCTLAATFLHAQAPDTLWTRTYGGADYDWGERAHQINDSMYAILANRKPFENHDMWLLGINNYGDTLWTKTIEGSPSTAGYDMVKTLDNKYIITGEYGVPDPNVLLTKVDNNGDILWLKHYGGSGEDIGWGVKQTIDSGYVICGHTSSYGAGYYDIWLVRTDAVGDTLWTKTYGGSGVEVGHSLVLTPDSGYIIVGYIYPFIGAYSDILVIRTNVNGDTLWTKTYGGSHDEYPYKIIQSNDSNYIIIGTTRSFGSGGYEIWLLKCDLMGDTIWTRTYGYPGGDEGLSIQQTPDGGFIIAGMTDRTGSIDGYLVKIDPIGNELWSKVIGGANDDYFRDIIISADNSYLITGSTYSYGQGLSDVWIIKTEPDVGIREQSTAKPIGKNALLNTTIVSGSLILPEGRNCKVFDITGRIVMPDKMRPGIYFIEVDGKITQKIIMIR